MHQVRHEAAWPLPRIRWTPLYLHADGALRDDRAVHAGEVRFDTRRGRATFAWIVPVDIELLPSATLIRAGELRRLDVQGRWFFPRNPLRGQFPAAYEPSPPATAVLHCGSPHDAHLLLVGYEV